MKNTSLVLGASLKKERYSHQAVKQLLINNHQVKAFGLKSGQIENINIDTELIFYQDIDTVTLYIGKKNQPEYYDYVISLNPNRVIFNPGTENPEFYKLLDENGIQYEVACTLVLLATGQY